MDHSKQLFTTSAFLMENMHPVKRRKKTASESAGMFNSRRSPVTTAGPVHELDLDTVQSSFLTVEPRTINLMIMHGLS